MRDFLYRHRYFLLTLLSVIIVMLFIFIINGIYPFGKDNFYLLNFDSYTVPIYYKLWDILHGEGSILVDWNLGGGLNIFSTLMMNSILFPSTLLIGLFPRESIPYIVNYILIIKMMTMAGIFYISVHKLFPKLSELNIYLFTMIYTFSGFSLLMMSNVYYLDAVSLFPLLVLGYKSLLKENKWKLYLISLTLIIICNFYIAYQVLFFIIGCTIIALLTLNIKDKIKKAIMVSFLTVLSIGLSCIFVLPAIYQYLTSYIITNNAYVIEKSSDIFLNKIIYLFPMGISIGIISKQFMVKKDKKFNIFLGILLIYLLLPVFIEPINIIWHIKGYENFPLRQSFIINYVLVYGCLFYLEKNYKNKNKYNKVNMIANIVLVLVTIVLALAFSDVLRSKSLAGYNFTNEQVLYGFIICVLFVLSSLAIFKLNKKNFNIMLIIISILNVLLFSYEYVVKINDPYIKSYNVQKISEIFKLPDDNYNYVNMASLNINYPLIIKRPAMNNAIDIIKSNEVLFADTFKYPHDGTIIKNYGGTMFTNALLMNKYYFTTGNLNDKFYTLLESHDGINLYESKYNFNYIIPYNGELFDEDYGSYIVNNNEVFKRLLGNDKDLFHFEKVEETDTEYKFQVKPDRSYYVSLDFYYDNSQGTVFDISEFNLDTELMYIDHLDSQLRFNFRTSEKKDIVLSKEKYIITGVEVGYIDDKEYINYMEGFNNLDVSVDIKGNSKIYEFNIEEDSDILIPINYDNSFKVYVNDEEVDYKCNLINMISIKVNKGDNKVVIKYVSKYFKEGIYISIISLILLILLVCFKRLF